MNTVDIDRDAAETLAPEALVEQVLQQGGKACLTNSFQIEDMVVLHLLRQVAPNIPVLFLDTGYHFKETYAYRDRIAKEWGLNLISLQAKQSVADQESAFGILNQTDPSRCCGLRKVAPLMEGLQPYDIWFTGFAARSITNAKKSSQAGAACVADRKIFAKGKPACGLGL